MFPSTPPCRVCGKTDWVVSWMLTKRDEAICLDCCKHPNGFKYDEEERQHTCPDCSAPAPPSYYEGWDQD